MKKYIKNLMCALIITIGLISFPASSKVAHAATGADLIITAVSVVPSEPEPNEAFDVYITIKNIGDTASGGLVIRNVFVDGNLSDFIGNDGCILNDDIDYYFTTDNNGSLDPDAESTLQVHVPGFASGTHIIWAYADGTCNVNESDKSNNYFGPITVAVSPTFADVPYSAFGWAHIESIYTAGITGGCSTNPALIYCPDNSVTRAQMAIFLLRGVHGKTYSPPAVGGSTGFADVPTNYWAAAWIKQLAAEGITGGCNNSNYCPENTVTRDQMAVFLLKAKYGLAYSPPAVGGTTGFADVPTNYWSAAWIKQLAAEGVTGGCGIINGNNNYCPINPVTRAQMAIFLQRTFNFALP